MRFTRLSILISAKAPLFEVAATNTDRSIPQVSVPGGASRSAHLLLIFRVLITRRTVLGIVRP